MRKQLGKVETVQKTWLSTREAMSYLDCSDKFLQKLREEAQISFSRVGNKFYYNLQSIERLFKKNQVV